ncbi:uncharacterized protein Z520_06563 [Fonsecaea multimorphosa CBS 102226]|uniref:Uncharacterized protein n=1 Tax=Fonsecaea multimorphosa CBS 102226 TaxID=1442371 RepID=A0A0D2H7G3_9EURO|nr:uncharacterized protein Z520_06563 [Fonsecaea multimorphosa CBS 102226]KIX97785.1 hypothetical protein Z520_06563 [Fonsecaea multimorphosa CBS 102226]OAL23805.1 hypothetical protein AYO22_06124 [Fonsecaea multimorphosa]
MSIPTEQFSHLAFAEDNPDSPLLEEMRFNDTPLAERKMIVRDIISSFDAYILPAEFKPDVYERITEEQARRAPTEWTIRDDLHATLMQWGSHDETAWTLLRRIAPRDRALQFGQKLRRRFNEQFERYDDRVLNARRMTAADLRTEIAEICSQLHALVRVATAEADRYNITMVLLEALGKVCERDDEVEPARRSGRLSMEGAAEGAEVVRTLYRSLIQDVSTDFMLDALDIIGEKWPRTLMTREARDQLSTINAILHEKVAPHDYQTRLQSLLTG